MKDWWAKVVLAVMLVALVMSFLLLPAVSYALTREQKVLVGLRGVDVLVEDMNPQAGCLGLTKAQIKMDVELRLRKAGVRVLTEEEWQKTPGMPFLYVKISTLVTQDSPIIAFSISVDLREWVTLDRGGETYGGIWHTGSVGTGGTSNTREIRGSVGDMVDKFINDYLAANPKK